MVSQEFITQNAVQTQELAERFAKKLKVLPATRQGGEVLALYGELGSGKTTFIQGLARGLGIKKRILSPTFTLIRHYTLSPKPYTLFHIDLYRLSSLEETEGLGLKEIWTNPENICAIEWAEKIKEILPNKRWEIYFEYVSDTERRVSINFLYKDSP